MKESEPLAIIGLARGVGDVASCVATRGIHHGTRDPQILPKNAPHLAFSFVRDKVSRGSHLSPLHPSHLSTRQRSPRGSPLRSWVVAPSLTGSPSIPRSLCANMTACVHPWFRHIFHSCLGAHTAIDLDSKSKS